MERQISGRTYDRQLVERQLEKARALADQREWPAVREQLAAVRTALAQAGSTSGYVSWLSAVAADHAGELVEAASLIREAGRIDPLNPETVRSAQIILGRVRSALTATEPPVPETASALYQALLDANHADRECHLAVARVYIASGDLQAAGRIADGLVALHPTWSPAWALKVTVVEAVGDEGILARVRTEATLALAASAPEAVAELAGRYHN